MIEMIDLGLIGLGYIGRVHLQNSAKLQNARLTAVADVSKKALNFAKKLGVTNTYNDYHELLSKSNVDAVIIALPTHLHAESSKAAAENHKHILLEKPLARTTVEGQDILDTAKKHGVKFMVGYPAIFSERVRKLKARIETGELGEIQMIYAVNVSTGPFGHRSMIGAPTPVPEWWWKKDLTGGGALMDLGSHLVNLMRWYFGNVAEVKSYLGYRPNLEQEDRAVCLLKFEQGQIGMINVCWFSQETLSKLEVYGTAGHATTASDTPSKAKAALQLLLRRTSDFHVPFLTEAQYFIDCILNDKTPRPSGEDALKDLEVIERAYANPVGLN
jgi:predicted dehydrogenase